MAGLFAAMKKSVTIAIFLFVLCAVFAACTDLPYTEVEIPQNASKTITVYVCGAVENEGYLTISAGTSYTELFRLAGILPQSALPELYSDTVEQTTDFVVVNYFDDGKICYCVNANSLLVTNDDHIDGLPDGAVNLLSAYIVKNGKIHNKQQLRVALGPYAASCLYKFFVAPTDYEEAD